MFDINRRDFLRNIFRIGVAGGLVTLGITLSSQSSESDPGSVECNKPNPCQQCNQVRGCTQPKALASLKRAEILSDSLKNKK